MCDGCDCPPWVVQCAHLGSRLLWIWSTAVWQAHHQGERLDDDITFTVFAADQADVELSRRWIYEGVNEAEALAAFREAERELIEANPGPPSRSS